MTNWYAVYTRPHSEKKVADAFSKKKLESYVPLTQPLHRWAMKKEASTVLFPCYVFVRLPKNLLTEVKKVDGVINLMYWMADAVIIRDIEIDMIRRFLSVHKQVQLEKTSVDTNAIVQLMQGSVLQKGNEIVAVEPSSASLLLPSLGYKLLSVVPHVHHAHQAHLHLQKQQNDLIKTN